MKNSKTLRSSQRLTMSTNPSLTTEQFERLMQAVAKANVKSGTYSHCTARYNGERDPVKLEEFIAAITTFKTVEKIEDDDAINSMPMLLLGDASEWWSGVKNKARKFEDVVRMLRESFCPPKPAWRIYAEIFEAKQQKNEATDTFIRKKRALFAKLPKIPLESDQIDILFGMLHVQIRDRVFRHKVANFDELLKDAREAEDAINERGKPVNTENPSVGGPVRCTYCRKKGHTRDNCFKKEKFDAEARQEANVIAQTTTAKPKLACYGCNMPGYVRANCPNCSGAKKQQNPEGHVHFNNMSMRLVGREIPVANIQMFGVPGQAYLDTGARTSIASANLKKIMDFHDCIYNKVRMEISLADGSRSVQECLSTVCKIAIGGKSFNIQFVILPNAPDNRTLLGADFLEQAAIILNMGQGYWCFEDDPGVHFEFPDLLPLNLNLLETIKTANTNKVVKNSSEAGKRKSQECEPTTPKRYNRQVHLFEFENFGPDITGNDYSPHSIQAIFKDCLPENEKDTPVRNASSELVASFEYDDDYIDSIFTPILMVDFKFLKPSDGECLAQHERHELERILQKHATIFGGIGEPTPYMEHFINTDNHQPIASAAYRLSFAKTRELKTEVDQMLELGIVEECESAWASPVVMVPKRDGGIRVCVDYRKLNNITTPDRYPLPRIDDLLHAAKSTKFMTTLDLQSGYYQIAVNEKDRDKTCFITPFGLFRFTRLPFGLRNAPATFQRLIDRFKIGLKDMLILAYLDDLIICSPTFNDHLRDLNLVFFRLEQFKLRINRSKCKFCCREVKYLGHILTLDGIAIDSAKTLAISEKREPKNVKELISFIQTCSWYRKFIDNYAQIAKPLTDLTKKGSSWLWGDIQRKSFQELKRKLITPPVLRQARDGIPFIIKTDASSFALGAVLIQGEGPDEHPIEYISRLLSNAERNYSTTEREALAIVWACAKFRGYIEGAEIILMTDHQPLKWLLTMKCPVGRLARWALQIQQYNFRVEYTPGKSNSVADMLSRPNGNVEEPDAVNLFSFQIDFPHKNPENVREEQMKDDLLKQIITCIESEDENLSHWLNRGYVMNDGVLYRYNNDESDEAQLVVPEHERSDILKIYHDESTAGHYGAERTIQRIASRYFWPGMRAEITKYTKSCIECQRFKASNVKPAGLMKTTSCKQRFEVLAVDLFGPLPTTDEGYQWILIAEDVASRWIELFPLKEATAEMCAKLLIEEVFLRYGVPRRLKTDNGVQFISAIMQQVTFCFKIQQQFTPVYHPQANPVERKNRDMKAQLAILVPHLSAIRFAMNIAKWQTTVIIGEFLTFGRELRTIDDLIMIYGPL